MPVGHPAPQEYYDAIYRYCYSKVRDTTLAEDLTQETFLRFFGQTSYVSEGKPLAYLYTVAKNLCTDHFRKRASLPMDDSFPAADEIEPFETGLMLRQAVSRLPSDLREIVLLRFAGGLRMGEIGNAVGISRFAVYRKLHRALQALRADLEKGETV